MQFQPGWSNCRSRSGILVIDPVCIDRTIAKTTKGRISCTTGTQITKIAEGNGVNERRTSGFPDSDRYGWLIHWQLIHILRAKAFASTRSSSFKSIPGSFRVEMNDAAQRITSIDNRNPAINDLHLFQTGLVHADDILRWTCTINGVIHSDTVHYQ